MCPGRMRRTRSSEYSSVGTHNRWPSVARVLRVRAPTSLCPAATHAKSNAIYVGTPIGSTMPTSSGTSSRHGRFIVIKPGSALYRGRTNSVHSDLLFAQTSEVLPREPMPCEDWPDICQELRRQGSAIAAAHLRAVVDTLTRLFAVLRPKRPPGGKDRDVVDPEHAPVPCSDPRAVAVDTSCWALARVPAPGTRPPPALLGPLPVEQIPRVVAMHQPVPFLAPVAMRISGIVPQDRAVSLPVARIRADYLTGRGIRCVEPRQASDHDNAACNQSAPTCSCRVQFQDCLRCVRTMLYPRTAPYRGSRRCGRRTIRRPGARHR